MEWREIFSFSLLAVIFATCSFWHRQYLGTISRSEFYFRCALILLVFLETRLGILCGCGKPPTDASAGVAGGDVTDKTLAHALITVAIFAACILSPPSPCTNAASKATWLEEGARERRRPLVFAMAAEDFAKGNAGQDEEEGSSLDVDDPSRAPPASQRLSRQFMEKVQHAREGYLRRLGEEEDSLDPEVKDGYKALTRLHHDGGGGGGGGGGGAGNPADRRSPSPSPSPPNRNEVMEDAEQEQKWGALETINNAIKGLFGFDQQQPQQDDQEVFNAHVQIVRRRTTEAVEAGGLEGDRRLRPRITLHSASSADMDSYWGELAYPLRPSEVAAAMCPPDPCTGPPGYPRSAAGPAMSPSKRGAAASRDKERSPKITFENVHVPTQSPEEEDDYLLRNYGEEPGEKKSKTLLNPEEAELDQPDVVDPKLSANVPTDVWMQDPYSGRDWTVKERRKVVHALDKSYTRRLDSHEKKHLAKNPEDLPDDQAKPPDGGARPPPEGQPKAHAKKDKTDADADRNKQTSKDRVISKIKGEKVQSKKQKGTEKDKKEKPSQEKEAAPKEEAKDEGGKDWQPKEIVQRYTEKEQDPFDVAMRSRYASPFQKTIIRPESPRPRSASFPERRAGGGSGKSPPGPRLIPVGRAADWDRLLPLARPSQEEGVAVEPCCEQQSPAAAFKRNVCLLLSATVFALVCYLLSRRFNSTSEFGLYWTGVINSKPCWFYYELFGLVAFALVVWRRTQRQESAAATTSPPPSSKVALFITFLVEVCGATMLLLSTRGPLRDYVAAVVGADSLARYGIFQDSQFCFYTGLFALLLIVLLLWQDDAGGAASGATTMDQAYGATQRTTSIWEYLMGSSPKEHMKLTYECDIPEEQWAKGKHLARTDHLPRPIRRTSYSGPPRP